MEKWEWVGGINAAAAGQQVKHLAAHTSINMEDLQGCQDQGWPQQKGMILPFQPLTLSFNNICYYVDMPHVGGASLLTLWHISLSNV